MTAKEMFEELGYRCENGYITDLYFIKQILKKQGDNYIIHFDLNDKSFSKYRSYNGADVFINLQEFKAIQKQIEELNW